LMPVGKTRHRNNQYFIKELFQVFVYVRYIIQCIRDNLLYCYS